MSTPSLLTGWTNLILWEWRHIPPSGLERGAPYLRSPLIGHPMADNWHLIWWCLPAQCPVGFLHRTVAEHLRKPRKGLGSLSIHHYSADRPVQTVRNAQEYFPGLSVTLRNECFQGFGEALGSGLVPLDDFSYVFAEDQDVIVFVEYPRLNV